MIWLPEKLLLSKVSKKMSLLFSLTCFSSFLINCASSRTFLRCFIGETFVGIVVVVLTLTLFLLFSKATILLSSRSREVFLAFFLTPADFMVMTKPDEELTKGRDGGFVPVPVENNEMYKNSDTRTASCAENKEKKMRAFFRSSLVMALLRIALSFQLRFELAIFLFWFFEPRFNLPLLLGSNNVFASVDFLSQATQLFAVSGMPLSKDLLFERTASKFFALCFAIAFY